MEEFDYEGYREELQRIVNSDEYQEMLKRTQKAMEEIAEAITNISKKIVETFNTIEWESLFKDLKEAQEKDVLEDYIRSRQRRHVRDSVRYRGGRRPSGRCRDWGRAELPAQKSNVRRWKLCAARMRRDSRRRRTS